MRPLSLLIVLGPICFSSVLVQAQPFGLGGSPQLPPPVDTTALTLKPLLGGDALLSGLPTTLAPTPLLAGEIARAAPEIPIAAMPAAAQLYWVSNSRDDRMRRLRASAAALLEQAQFHGWLISTQPISALMSPYFNDSAEELSFAERENVRQYLEVVAEIQSLGKDLQMKAAPVPDEVYPVAHDGEYSVQSSGTGQQVSYVRQNPADSSPKPTTRVVVDYHFVDVQLPAGFAQDGTPLTKPGRTLVRTEHEE